MASRIIGFRPSWGTKSTGRWNIPESSRLIFPCVINEIRAEGSKTTNTSTGIDPVCETATIFEKVIQGTYNISVAAPAGYNPTTQVNYTLEIKPGEQIFVDFGAQKGGEAQPEEPVNQPGSSNWLGIAGGILLLAGAGLGIYAWQVYGRRPSYTLHK